MLMISSTLPRKTKTRETRYELALLTPSMKPIGATVKTLLGLSLRTTQLQNDDKEANVTTPHVSASPSSIAPEPSSGKGSEENESSAAKSNES